ncbi:MAG: helix-turn-helix transcriptional regulator [Roseovarius sp.]
MLAQEQDAYLSCEQVAEFTGLSRSFFEKLRVRGDGPPYCKISPRRVLYARKDVIAWIEGHRVQSTSEEPGQGGVPATQSVEAGQ